MHDMKDSGVAWIGAVPSGYRTASIGSLFTIKKDIIGREPETVLSITQTGIRPKDLSSNEGQNASSYAHYQIVNMGDFAMNHMDLLTGWIDISKYEGVTSPDYRVFTLNDKEMSADYFLRVFQYYYTNKVFFGFGQGVATLGRWRLPAINFKKIDVPVPPVLEQQRIVSAIDEKVGKVDALIANVQTQIEKLKAYKQSVITETVTKGLDPDVQMKDSGVEWIGEIPEHWKIAKIKIGVTKVGSGKTPLGGAETYSSEGVLFLRSQNIYDEGINLDSPTYITDTIDEEMKGTRVKPYDVLLNITGGSIGRCCIFPPELERANVNQHVSIIRVIDSIFTPDYMHYYWNSNIGKMSISLYQTGGNREGMSADAIKNSPIMVIPIQEQKVITTYLDHKCSHIDKLITLKQQKIEKLQQYKKSLIYEYVTGKKEV